MAAASTPVILMPFLGLLIPMSDQFFASPTFLYAHSLDRTATGSYVEIAMAEVGITWIGKKGAWAGFYPAYLRDFEADDSHINYGFDVGKVFSSGLGLSIRYDDVEFFIPGSIPSEQDQFDQIITVNLHLVF